MQIRLDNQVALVNCASSGIGRARALAQQIVDQGGQAIAVRADVTDANDVDRLVRTTVDALGGFDVVGYSVAREPGCVWRVVGAVSQRWA